MKKNIIWKGTSLHDLKSLPKQVREAAGFQLDRLLSGVPPLLWRSLSFIDPHLKEMQLLICGDYRLFYLDRVDHLAAISQTIPFIPHFRECIYILHVCQYESDEQLQQQLEKVRHQLRTLFFPESSVV
ncbi:MAG: hypothetical protein JSS53_01530 [Proteobacteria bacterium]|nr:hypothetical protein [Pseudomonadota bacterium]